MITFTDSYLSRTVRVGPRWNNFEDSIDYPNVSHELLVEHTVHIILDYGP